MQDLGEKKCNKCIQFQPISHFSYRSDRPGKLHTRCNDCRFKYHKNYNDKYKSLEKNRITTLKVYGITITEFEKLFTVQGGVCKICNLYEVKTGKSLSVDHCHKSKKIRGLLCGNCNAGLGSFDDNTDLLYRAIDYLKNNVKFFVK